MCPSPIDRRKTAKKALKAINIFFFIPHLGSEACDLAPIFHLWLLISDNKTVPLQ